MARFVGVGGDRHVRFEVQVPFDGQPERAADSSKLDQAHVVHPDFQRRGIARALLQHIEESARALDLRRLYTEASITARPAFEAVGFRVILPQTVTVRGESMTNYRMEKRLDDLPKP